LPEHRPLVERHEGDDALGAARKCHLLASDFDAEAREQPENDLPGGTVITPRYTGFGPQGRARPGHIPLLRWSFGALRA